VRTTEAAATAAQYKNATTAIADFLLTTLRTEMPHVRTADDVARLSPELQGRFNQLDSAYREAMGEASHTGAALAAQAQAQQQHAFAKFVTEQEHAVQKLVPELSDSADPVARRELQQASVDVLHGVGYTDSELHSSWMNGAPVSLRDARAQAIISKAAKWDRMQAREKDLVSHRKPIPRVQRPGVSGQQTTRAENEIMKLEAKGGLSIKEATQLMRARRARA
jgi:hypothetical protein